MHMKTADSPFIADWLVISLRWLTLLALSVSLGLSNGIGIWSGLVLALGVLWNLGLTVLAALNTRLSYHRQLNVFFDLIWAIALSLLLGSFDFRLVLAGLMPIFSTSLYFEWRGALLTAFLYALFATAYGLLLQAVSPLLLGVTLALILIFGATFGFLGYRVIEELRARRRAFLAAEAEKRRVENERLRAVYELASALTSTLSYQRIIESALDLADSALSPEMDPGANPLVSAVLLFREGKLYVAAEHRFTLADRRVELEGEQGLLKTLFDERVPVLTQRISTDPELGRIVAFRNCTSAYCLPLYTGLELYGALIFAHPQAQYFTEERRDILDILARQMSTAIQNARLYQSLLEEKERMAEIHEEARKKLARDLHDGPTQSVSAIAMRLNIVRRLIERDAQKATEELAKIEDLAHRTVKEIRHMLFTLRPLVLETQGLQAALQAMADKMRETFNQNVIIEVDDSVLPQLEVGKQGVIFSIAEEAVNNARKHARAANIWVRLKPIQSDLLLLEIQDDGVGFDVKSVMQSYEKRGSLGMVNLTERTELINGVLNILSAPGKGTRVQVFIPLTEEAADRLHQR
ncbi:MAG: GAF domain-containing sensor histidine kinase [Anaerolineales bacterium]